MGQKINKPALVYKILFGTAEVKRPLVRPWHRLEDNIKKDLRNNSM
jgi:hypothetical protein